MPRPIRLKGFASGSASIFKSDRGCTVLSRGSRREHISWEEREEGGREKKEGREGYEVLGTDGGKGA